MSSNNDGRGANTSYALMISERKTLAETRSFTQKCGSKIAEDQTNVANKGWFGLWWDAKGLFNCSNAEEVIADMERYKSIFEKIEAFSAQVERGDDPQKSDDTLLYLYDMIGEKEMEAKSDKKNKLSKATCQMLREYLHEIKYNLDHNLKKVECIVLRQRNHAVEQTRKSDIASANEISKKMDELREENSNVRREYAEKLRKMKEESDQAAEENNRRWETRMQEMTEQNKLMLKTMNKMLEAMNLS